MPDKSNSQDRTLHLSHIKRSLLRKRLRGKSPETVKLKKISRLPSDGDLDLSFSQQRLWFLHQLEPDSLAYNLTFCYKIIGTLDISIFEHSLSEIVNRHETLRTTYKNVDANPSQIITDRIKTNLSLLKIQNLPSNDIKAFDIINKESQHKFDLASGPIFRATLLKLSATEYIFIFVVHHIAFDGWSNVVFLRELQTYYTASITGKSSPLTPLEIQYADFAQWQRDYLQENVLENLLDFWKKQLGSSIAPLQLPTDQLRPKKQTYRGSCETFELTITLSKKIKQFSQEHGVTLFMTLLSAFQILLYRYTGQNNFGIGSPIAGRKRPELENLIGLFVNTLVLKSDVEGNPSFKELVNRVRERTLNAYDNQDLPFEKLVEELQPDRDMSYSPLFQVMFVLQNFPVEHLSCSGIKFSQMRIGSLASMFDLTLYMHEEKEKLGGTFEYCTDLFNRDTIERLAANFLVLLENLVTEPDLSIAKVPLLAKPEQDKLAEWNHTETAYPKNSCFHTLFEKQALADPTKIAIEFQGNQISYAQLNHKANQLAHYIKDLGVGPNVLVGLFVDRSIDMMVGLLGILKAGGAYVPLDPDYPTERLSYMMEESKSPVLITQSKFKSDLPETDAQVIYIDSDWDRISQNRTENPVFQSDSERPGPEDLAYVIFTSGSTGKPKGVQIPHRAVTNFLTSMSQTPGVAVDDTLLAVTTLSFDIHVLELYTPLIVGAKVVIASRETAFDGEQLAELLTKANVTVMQATPSTWRLMIAAGWKGSTQLKALCGGEAFPKDLVGQLLERVGSLWNMYGPTETTVWSTCYQIKDADDPVLVGHPIANTQTYVLDTEFQPVPIGVAGELYIGGDGVTHGYLNRADLTSEAFIPDPFSGKLDTFIYKTGDLVKYHADGNIEYFNRLDNQVKVRGFRIELGEIEAALGMYPAIKQAIAGVKEFGPGDQRLICYYEKQKGQTFAAGDLRNHLRQKLPDYMIPQHFAEMETFPLTPAGKIDRKFLSTINITQTEARSYEPPRNEIESELVEIWQTVLGIQQVGIHDNFFEIGGHSLLGMQLYNDIEKKIGKKTSLASLFMFPTIAEFAGSLDLQRNIIDSSIAKIGTIDIPERIPLSSSQVRMWYLHQLESTSTLWNLPVAYRLKGLLSYEHFQSAINHIAERHEILRTHFSWEDDIPYQVVNQKSDIKVLTTDLSGKSSDQQNTTVSKILTKNAQTRFEMTNGPLLRVELVKLSAQEHILFFMAHHAIWDGSSFDIFLKELDYFYGLRIGRRPDKDLPTLPVQYKDYAIWQNLFVESPHYVSQMNYWREKLSGQLPFLELQTDRMRPPVIDYAGDSVSSIISNIIGERLNQIGQKHNATLFMVFATIFNVLLYRYTGQKDLVIGTPIQGRILPEVENLIGFFVNTIVLRSDMSGAPSFLEILKKVKDTCSQAYSNQDIPFERLVEEINPERDLSRTPIFQAMITMLDTRGHRESLGDLRKIPELVNHVESPTDLHLFIELQADKISCSFDYCRSLFNRDTIERLAANFLVLLENLVTEPDLSIAKVPLLAKPEQDKLAEWNHTETAYPKNSCFHTLFEKQALADPTKIAIEFQGNQISYAQLNHKANQLAHYIKDLGVGPNVLVGLFVDRSIDMMVGLLGILKAGGAYVPLDPDYPTERLSYMMEESKSPVLITQSKFKSDLPETDAQVIYIDSDWDRISQNRTENPVFQSDSERPGPEDLAYVIFTSGSTGKPKGVQIPHRAVTNFLTSMSQTPGVAVDDTLLAVTTLSFDIHVLELYTPLIVGAKVVIASRETAFDGEQLAELLTKANVTVMQATPSTWRLMIAAGWKGSTQLKALCGGEAFPKDLVGQLLERVGSLWNMYGPTETTVWSTCYQIKDADDPVLVGHPIANTQTYVLDTEFQPVPIGVAGELYIGGDGVTHGYLNRADLTSEAFIPDPFSGKLDTFIYKTGDLVKYHADGNIEYFNRLDNQVKVRGFRIELGEIEAALGMYPAIKQAIAGVKEFGPGDQRLICYYEKQKGQTFAAGDLRNHLRQKLPDYMIPQHFAEMETFPLTPAGKIDRKFLSTINITQTEARSYEPPRNEIESELVEIWQTVLGIQQVGIHDNFFEIGGHSLLGMQVINRLRKCYPINISVALIFEAPTIELMSQSIEKIFSIAGSKYTDVEKDYSKGREIFEI